MARPTIHPEAGAARALPLTSTDARDTAPDPDFAMKAASLLQFCRTVNGILPLDLPIVNMDEAKLPLITIPSNSRGFRVGAVMMTGTATYPNARAAAAPPRKGAP